jgi:hypothetical protein
MKAMKFLLLAVFLFSFFGLVNAAYVTIGASGAPFDINESITFSGTMDSNNVDLNVFVKDVNGTIVDENYLGDQNSSFSIQYSFANAGDYNIFVHDLNNDVNAWMSFNVTQIASVKINWDNLSLKPPFSTSDGGSIVPVTFTLYNATDTALGSGIDVNVNLYDMTGTLQDTNSGTTNSDGNVQLNFTLPSSAGNYYFLVNKGIAAFPFPVYSFKMIPSLIDPDTNNLQNSFKPEATAQASVQVTNYAGTQYISDATVTGTLYDSSGNTESTLSFTGSGGQYTSNFTVPSTQGTYYLEISVTYGGVTQTQKNKLESTKLQVKFLCSKI